MRNVRGVVYAEADDEDDADADDGVDGQAPEVDEAHHVDERQDDAREHEHAELDGGQGCQMAKFDPFLSLDCARVEGVGAQSKERKGSNFAA